MDNKKCITIDQISVTDGSKSRGGVPRCIGSEVTSSGSAKRRKFGCRDQENVVESGNQRLSQVDVNSSVSSAESDSFDQVFSSPCFQNCLRLDLKTELRLETETFMSVNGGFSGVTSSGSKICSDSERIESFSRMRKKPAPPRTVTRHRKPPATSAKLPTAAEIEEFFSAAEKKEQKRFSDKYNFDIVNDVPMDGRYQWVRLKP